MPHFTLRRFPRIVTLMLAALIGLGVATGASADAPAAGGTGTAPTPTSTTGKCAVLRVQLNGAQPATSTCLAQAPQGQGMGQGAAMPGIRSLGCPVTDLKIYQDTNFGGLKICFTGSGIINLSDFPYYHTPFPWIPPGDWSDRMSSFVTGQYYVNFYEHKNAGGQRLRYASYQSRSSMPSGWNDRVSSVCFVKDPNPVCP